MEDKQNLLRQLPQVDETMGQIAPRWEGLPNALLKETVQEQIQLWRENIRRGALTQVVLQDLHQAIETQLEAKKDYHFRGVINATGVILHTNLGRARLSQKVLEQLDQVGARYTNLEYDLQTGERGSRYQHVENLLTKLTGAEAALVVNNNAAAVFLALNTLTQDKEVLVSRGELVEIGGSFRIPNIIETSGCKLVEVGTTNKTRLSDYTAALTDQTGALLKVHTSNYTITGFTEETSLEQLSALGKANSLPVIYDLGSGLLMDLSPFGITTEPTVAACVPHADLLTFSGDKLLGGPQAGILVGKKQIIQRMKHNHLLRALRIDKLTLSALEATLWQYLDPKTALEEIPTLQMLTATKEQLYQKAQLLLDQLTPIPGLTAGILETSNPVGGGSLPSVTLPSYAVSVHHTGYSPTTLAAALRRHSTPIIPRIWENQLLLDLRTIDQTELSTVTNCFIQLAKE